MRGLFDEIVVVDTGSSDRTVAIAREFGARVVHFAWVDDFAAARNIALAHATGDYAFWLDADDLIEPPERKKLEALLDRIRTEKSFRPPAGSSPDTNHPTPPPVAYVLDCACDPGPGGSGGRTVVNHIRLFPRLPGVRWTYKVHEQILPALRRLGVAVEWTGITIRHTGYTDPALREKKLDRDTRILLGELGERPNDPDFRAFNQSAARHPMEANRSGVIAAPLKPPSQPGSTAASGGQTPHAAPESGLTPNGGPPPPNNVPHDIIALLLNCNCGQPTVNEVLAGQGNSARSRSLRRRRRQP